MGDFGHHQNPILKAREARLQDLRWRRAVGGSSADLAVSPEMLTPRCARRSMESSAQSPILKGSAADLQDLRWRRAVGGYAADLAVPPEMLTSRFATRSMNFGSVGGQQA
jgi:hypothetical protein